MKPAAASHLIESVVVAGRRPVESSNPREARALLALLQGPLKREALDRAAGVSNSPDLVMNMRRSMGLTIPCKRAASIDRDGKACKPGIYSLTGVDRSKVLRWLRSNSNRGDEQRFSEAEEDKFATPPSMLEAWRLEFEAAADSAVRDAELTFAHRNGQDLPIDLSANPLLKARLGAIAALPWPWADHDAKTGYEH